MLWILVSIDSLPRRPRQRTYLVDFVVLGLKIAGPNCIQLMLLHVSRLSGQLGAVCNRWTLAIWFSRSLEHISFGVGVRSTQQQKSASAECALTFQLNCVSMQFRFCCMPDLLLFIIKVNTIHNYIFYIIGCFNICYWQV